MSTTAKAEEENATWGLDRIDQRALPLDSTYSYENTGEGVFAYILDTGKLMTRIMKLVFQVDGKDATR